MSRRLVPSLLLAARPKTLAAALAPVLAGTAVAAFEGYTVRWWISVLALLGAVAIQIGTNLFNDLIDFERGADDENRLGPTRVTQSGALTPRQVRWAAVSSFGLAVLIGIPLVALGGWPILVLGLLSLLFGYAYTGGPYPLAYNGLGEIFVLLFFGIGAVGGTYYLHAGGLDATALLVGVQMGLLAVGLLAVNNLRDVAADERARKRTLVVRFGKSFGRGEILVCCLLPFALNLVWLWGGALVTAVAPWLAFPLALIVVRGVYTHDPGAVYNAFLARSAALQLAFGLLLSIGLLW